jgi:hypothetical protein
MEGKIIEGRTKVGSHISIIATSDCGPLMKVYHVHYMNTTYLLYLQNSTVPVVRIINLGIKKCDPNWLQCTIFSMWYFAPPIMLYYCMSPDKIYMTSFKKQATTQRSEWQRITQNGTYFSTNIVQMNALNRTIFKCSERV